MCLATRVISSAFVLRRALWGVGVRLASVRRSSGVRLTSVWRPSGDAAEIGRLPSGALSRLGGNGRSHRLQRGLGCLAQVEDRCRFLVCLEKALESAGAEWFEFTA